MGLRATNPAAQTKPRTKVSGSGSSSAAKPAKASASISVGTPKPPTRPKKSRAVESDEAESDELLEEPPSKGKKVGVVRTTMKSDGKAKPSTSKKEVQPSNSKSPLAATTSRGNPGPKSVGKKRKGVPEPVEADSGESEDEWVGFGQVDEESDEGEEEEDGGDDEDKGEEEGGDDSSEEELLHGLSSDDDQDSSDEEVELPTIDISKLPTIAKDDKIVKRKLEKAKRHPVCIAFTTVFRGLNFGFVADRGPGGDLPRSCTPRVPRGANERVLHPVRRHHSTPTITKQKGSSVALTAYPS
jgi:nucleolar protein 15